MIKVTIFALVLTVNGQPVAHMGDFKTAKACEARINKLEAAGKVTKPADLKCIEMVAKPLAAE